VNNASADRYSRKNTEWASQVNNWVLQEPTVRNLDAFEKSPYSFDVMDMFVKKFRETSDSLYQIQNWDNGLNFRERMAVMEQKVKEQESNKQKSPLRKTGRSSNPDL
jgi:hypothetical protein